MKKIIAFFLVIQLAHTLSGQKLARIEVDSLMNYGFEKFGTEYISDFIGEPTDTVRANLIVNSDPTRDIKFVKATLSNDTLHVLIHQTDPAYHHEYRITAIGYKYFIKYRFLTSGDTDDNGEVFRKKTVLKLKTLNFIKGKEISGYTEFFGTCIDENCHDGSIFVKGNFKVIVK